MDKTWMFVTSLVGMTVSAALLILLVPSFFQPGTQASLWSVGVLSVLTLAFAAGTLHLRPSVSNPNNG